MKNKNDFRREINNHLGFKMSWNEILLYFKTSDARVEMLTTELLEARQEIKTLKKLLYNL